MSEEIVMSFKIDIRPKAQPLVVEAEIRTNEEYNEFLVVLAKKWWEYQNSTCTWQGAVYK